MNIETKDRLAETNIIVVESGVAKYYEYPVEEKEIEEDLLTKNTEVIDLKSSTDSTESIQTDETKSETIAENKDKVIYRVQLGYFEKDLSSNIFEGLNVISVKKGSGTFYLIGSFTKYQDDL